MSARTESVDIQSVPTYVLRLVSDLTDGGECWFDHHGGCQEHGYLSLGPGEMCPHAEAKLLIQRAKDAGIEVAE